MLMVMMMMACDFVASSCFDADGNSGPGAGVVTRQIPTGKGEICPAAGELGRGTVARAPSFP